MSVHAQAETKVTPTPLRSSSGSTTSGLLQRRCACGGAADVTGECEGCRKKRLALQTKLAVNEPGDIYEQEADRIADQMLASSARSAVSSAPPRIQRLSASPSGQVDAAPASVDQALANPGMPLDAALRLDMEQRFGHDFSRVRVHTGASAEQSARDVNAHAYAVGHRIVFDAGRFAPTTREGRGLLAHELTHVVQQDSGLTIPRIQRKARTYTVKPDHAPMSAGEVLILMAMTSRKISREAAIKLIANDEYECGEHPACLNGVADTKPIQFTIGLPEPKAKSAPAKKAAPKKAVAPDPPIEAEQLEPRVALPAEIESALNDPYVKRFFAIGTQENYLRLPAGQPNPDEYVLVNYIRDAVMRLSEEELQCYRGFAAGGTFATWTDIANSLNEFSKLKADWCHQGKHPDPTPRERLRGLEGLHAAIKEREAMESLVEVHKLGTEGGASRVPYALMKRLVDAKAAEARELSKAGFGTLDDFDRAANEFRLYFRAYAIPIAERMLFESGRVLQDAVRRYQIRGNQVPRDCQELYDELYRTYGGRSVDQLKDAHPILRNPAALKAVSRAKNVYEFSWRLTLYANERLRDLGFVQNNLRREPDVVFRFDVVVERTLADLALGKNSVFASVIREQRGKPSSSLGEKIVRFGVEVLLFALNFIAPPVGMAIGIARAAGTMITEGTKYEAGMREVDVGVREKEPSLTPVILPLVVELAPTVFHGAFRWLKKPADVAGDAAKAEKLAATGAGAERKVAQSLDPPKIAPKPSAPHVEPRPPVTAEPSVARPAVDVKPPSAPRVTPVATEPAPRVPTAEAPPVIKPDPRLAQAEAHLASTQAKADAARTRLAAAGEKVTAADEAAKVADAELALARQEATAARSAEKRAARAYDKAKQTKDAPRAQPRADHFAAKDAAKKAEKKLEQASTRVKAAKADQRQATKAVPRQQTAVSRAEQDVAAAQHQRAIEIEADLIRNSPKNVEGLPRGWDYERFPTGPRRAWQPGDAINMPDAKGNYPVWATVRMRIWKNRATDELAERAAGRSVRATIPPKPKGPVDPNAFEEVPKGGLPWLDPIREATNKELAVIASSGRLPRRLTAEIEHARIPQRVGDDLVEVGVDPNIARRVTKVGDPDNLMPTRQDIHAILDHWAHFLNPARNPKLRFSLDLHVRAHAPFREATDAEIGNIVKAIKDSGIDLGKTEVGANLRGFLEAEKKLRPSSTWEVP